MEKIKSSPNYLKIYSDIVNLKYPNKRDACKFILEKNRITVLDVIELNNKIFEGSNNNLKLNQKHRSYSKEDILYMLDYQKKNKLNNTELAHHFSLSRNTVTKWKKLFLV